MENLWRRQNWWEKVSELIPACLVFLCETGVTTEITRRYGWRRDLSASTQSVGFGKRHGFSNFAEHAQQIPDLRAAALGH